MLSSSSNSNIGTSSPNILLAIFLYACPARDLLSSIAGSPLLVETIILSSSGTNPNNFIANYAEIEEDGLEIKMSKARGENDDMPVSALVANIPLRSLKDRQI